MELCCKAGRHAQAAKLLSQLAKKAIDNKAQPQVVKKLYVLSGLQAEAHRRQEFQSSGLQSDALHTMAATRTNAGATTVSTSTSGAVGFAGATAYTAKNTVAAATQATLRTLLEVDTKNISRELEAPWHGAEAYHFWMLCQRQLYLGNVDMATRTALHLLEYEDVLGVEELNALIAICTLYAGLYGQCSKAFIRLEALPANTKVCWLQRVLLSCYLLSLLPFVRLIVCALPAIPCLSLSPPSSIPRSHLILVWRRTSVSLSPSSSATLLGTQSRSRPSRAPSVPRISRSLTRGATSATAVFPSAS